MDPLTQLAIWATIYLLQAAFAPKPEKPDKPAFEDFDFPLSEEGSAKAAYFGQCKVEGWFVLTVGNYRTRSIKTKGGKK